MPHPTRSAHRASWQRERAARAPARRDGTVAYARRSGMSADVCECPTRARHIAVGLRLELEELIAEPRGRLEVEICRRVAHLALEPLDHRCRVLAPVRRRRL